MNGIGPGATMAVLMMRVVSDKETMDAILCRIPAGRFGSIDKIGRVVVFLASDGASIIHASPSTLMVVG